MKSGQLSARLADAGYVLPNVAAPVAAYVPAVVLAGADKRNRLVQTSGQLPMVEGKLVATGKAGVGEGLLDAKYVYQLAKVCALNALAAAAQAAGGVDRIIGVEKVTAFVASDPTFYDQALVANGASEFFGELFDDGHARSAVGVAVLPLNAPVEVEVLFRVK
ncbi:MAG: RidA family protein [Actinomycetaceae bacterium]|nr:RidA family protein [Actinomycetaceae bacterium]